VSIDHSAISSFIHKMLHTEYLHGQTMILTHACSWWGSKSICFPFQDELTYQAMVVFSLANLRKGFIFCFDHIKQMNALIFTVGISCSENL
jgi:hypothetical protein